MIEPERPGTLDRRGISPVISHISPTVSDSLLLLPLVHGLLPSDSIQGSASRRFDLQTVNRLFPHGKNFGT